MRMMQFGLRAHDFGRTTAESLADALAPHAPISIQLALGKAFTDAPRRFGMMSPGYARRIRDVFAERGICIAVLGCYINPVHPDPDALESGLRRFEEHLRFARDFACAVVGTETGSLNADCSYHPKTNTDETFDTLCRSIERLIRTAERFGIIIGVEAVARNHTIDSVERMDRLLKRIDSPNLQVIYDPVNLLPWEGLPEADGSVARVPSREAQRRFFSHAFETFGERIAAIHLKDFRYAGGWKKGDLAPLTGDLDTEGLLGFVAAHKPCIDVLLENSDMQTASLTLATLRRMAGDMPNRNSD